MALNSLGINISRAIGPAAGGLLVASFGAAMAYGADVSSYLIVIVALLFWKRPPATDSGLSEQFLGAFRAGLRYARSSTELHVVLLRAAVFFLFASSVWALLPLLTRRMLGGTAGFYGVMLGAVGAGAIVGALLLPKLRQRLSADGLVLLSSVLSAGVMAALSLAPAQWVAVVLMLFLGAGWIIALTTFNGVAQAVLPNWVRGRGLAIYLMVFNGAMAGGSLGWGLFAQEVGIPTALLVGGVGLVIASLLFNRVKLPTGEADLQASNHWPEPMLAEPVAHDRGPVLIQIEYRIARKNLAAFMQAMQRVERERRRDGAYAWGVAEHTGETERVIEWFMVESWAEHLRQHQRVSKADADMQDEALAFHEGAEPPVVHHFLALHGPVARKAQAHG